MKIKCLICGDVIETKSVHDLVTCKCESCYIDGENYIRIQGQKILIKLFGVKDDGKEVKLNLE